MKSIDLSARLLAVARLVPKGARVADVGTDHGYVPAWLLARGIPQSCAATDINPGPLASAKRTLESCGAAGSVRLVLCDGLDGVLPNEADTVIIAGMGGDNITGILRRAPWALHGRLLILQPMTKAERLRRFLCESSVGITGEYLVRDSGRLYPVLTARGGGARELTETELITGEYGLASKQELFPELLDELIRKHARVVTGMERAEDERPGLAHERGILDGLIKMREAYENDNGKRN